MTIRPTFIYFTLHPHTLLQVFTGFIFHYSLVIIHLSLVIIYCRLTNTIQNTPTTIITLSRL